MVESIGSYPLSGVRMPTWLLRFDKRGACTSPATRARLLDQLRNASPSDIILFSHGWNNDFDDAAGMYAGFLRNFEALCASHLPGRPFEPLFVGVFWPSIWLSFDKGPQIAAASGAGPVPDAAVVEALAERLVVAGGNAALEIVYALLAKDKLDDAETRQLVTLVAPAFGTVRDDEAGGGQRATSADDLFAMLRAMQQAQDAGASPAPQARLDDWAEPAAGVPAGGPAGVGAATDVQTAGLFSALDPRNVLRLFTVYQMKDRAGIVGSHGIAPLLRDLLTATSVPGTPVHVAGHSYGCKVVLSAICEPTALPRPVSSLLLLQPAVSHLCFADQVPGSNRPGGYAAALQANRVRGPIFSTYSRQDFPLHEIFHLALRRDGDLGEGDIGLAAAGEDTSAGKPPSRFAALGGYGPRRARQHLVDPMPRSGEPYPAAPAGTAIVSFDGSSPGLIGAHGDISDTTCAWALHRLVFR